MVPKVFLRVSKTDKALILATVLAIYLLGVVSGLGYATYVTLNPQNNPFNGIEISPIDPQNRETRPPTMPNGGYEA
jgi:hypothetical protein